MGRTSSIAALPPDILEKFQALLRDPRVTQLDATQRINAILEGEGHPERVSKSAVNRYAVKMEEVGKKIRQSREVAELWIGKMGAQPQGKVGQFINETLRTLALDVTLKLQQGELDEDSLPGVVNQLKTLSLAMQRLENAANLNMKRETEIRRQALEDAAKVVEKEAEAEGGKDERMLAALKRVREEIYGIV